MDRKKAGALCFALGGLALVAIIIVVCVEYMKNSGGKGGSGSPASPTPPGPPTPGSPQPPAPPGDYHPPAPPPNVPAAPPAQTGDKGLSLPGSDNGKISCWAWNALVTGGFMGYGIFANKTGGYTWTMDDTPKAVGNDDTITTTWDDQTPNSMLNHSNYDDLLSTLNAIDSGSQFWDFVSKKGSYYTKNNNRSLDGIKIQYEGESGGALLPGGAPGTSLSTRLGNLIQNLIGDGLVNVGILIGGKPKQDGSRYHGVPFSEMKEQITNAVTWITGNHLGDKVYIALDIEPADVILNSPSMQGDYSWYTSIFPQVADHINSFSGQDVYFGMAINKNPYSDPDAYKAWQKLMKANWLVDQKERGFRVIELMYWFTYNDFIDAAKSVTSSHLYKELMTSSDAMNQDGNPSPVTDAYQFGVYLQFGMETTGEIDTLIYVPKSPTDQTSCGTTANPEPADCYRSMNGMLTVNDGLAYHCKDMNSKLDNGQAAFTNLSVPDDDAWYFQQLAFTGTQDEYAAVYGYPYVPYCKGGGSGTQSSKYNTKQCDMTGRCLNESGDGDPLGEWGPPTPVYSEINPNSCKFLNKQTFMLGGGLGLQPDGKDTGSLEKWLHSGDAIDYITNVVTQVIKGSTIAGAPMESSQVPVRNLIFKIPFCVEDISGYSGLLYNFDKKNVPANTACSSDPTDAAGKDTMPCLAQSVWKYNSGTKQPEAVWLAGTLKGDNSCPLEHYFGS